MSPEIPLKQSKYPIRTPESPATFARFAYILAA
jgi:hypothetical protein